MGAQIEVTFKKLWPSDEVMEMVQQGTETLQDHYGDIEHCHVVVERPKGRRGKGRRYRVSVNVKSTDLDVREGATASSEHTRLQRALSNAFHTVGPRLDRLKAA
jgi:ribosome-associated translation inhibitor RaiA